MEKRRIYVIASLCVVLIVLLFFMIKNSLPKKPTVSPNILALSQPINSISGMIEKIDKNAFYITDQASKLKFKVNTSKNTSFVRSPVTIPYLFLNNAGINISTRINFEDLKVKDMVYISTKEDLRTVVNNKFEALIVSKSAGSNSIGGVITEIGNGIIRVKTTTKTYRVDIPSTCEISVAAPQPTRFFFSDLKIGEQITAYTEDDVNQTNDISALRIEPIGLALTAPLPTPLPPSSQLTPTTAPLVVPLISPTIHVISPTISITPFASPSSTLKTR